MSKDNVITIKGTPKFPGWLKWAGHGLFTGTVVAFIMTPTSPVVTFLLMLTIGIGWLSFRGWYHAYNGMALINDYLIISKLLNELEKDGTFLDEDGLTKYGEESDDESS